MTLKNKIMGTIFTTYLGLVLGGASLGSYLIDNFNYSRKMDNGIVVKVENIRGKEKIIPEKVIIAQGKSSLVGIDSDNNESLDKIVFNIESKDAAESLLPLATEERLTQIYNEIMESEDYRETIKRRQDIGNPLLSWSFFLGLMGLPASGVYKFSHATSKQLAHPYFHTR